MPQHDAYSSALDFAKHAGALTAHGLKHRGITDTPGNKADKQTASGHKTPAMLNVYDHDAPVVDPAGDSNFTENFTEPADGGG